MASVFFIQPPKRLSDLGMKGVDLRKWRAKTQPINGFMFSNYLKQMGSDFWMFYFFLGILEAFFFNIRDVQAKKCFFFTRDFLPGYRRFHLMVGLDSYQKRRWKLENCTALSGRHLDL